MKKIPTLFKREYENHRIVNILPEVTEGMEWVLEGKGVATVKWDGACCAIINGVFYKRYDAKKGKKPPEGAIPCQPEPDPITGHWPHWVKVNKDDPADKWFWEAYNNSWEVIDVTELTRPKPGVVQCLRQSIFINANDGTYEAVGKHFQGNPYQSENDTLIPHGTYTVDGFDPSRTFDGIRTFLERTNIEGIVFWDKPKDEGGEPKCKIKRTDFGFSWPIR